MTRFDHTRYRPCQPVRLTARRWPDRTITRAPRWASVDLRDGNQALLEPMGVAQKERLFKLLCKLGFKEIEVGFPAASQPDYDFVRRLIEGNMIPDDVTIQVLVQARAELIERTYQALAGVKRAIVHVYNSTSAVQRERVFGLDRAGIKAIAVEGATLVRDGASRHPGTEWTFEYSPESFTDTELDFALEVCDAVLDIWQPTPALPAIINLPATVEVATPNVYADQIEWFCDRISRRDSILVSVHTHNDRGCAVAAAELAVMAGADRVEGTLLGNGERTGNMDIVTMAMNLYSQGVDPKLDLSGMDEIIQTVTACTGIALHPRHPYAGELVFTAFSGSHQDAINKCLHRRDAGEAWRVAYLPIDPADIGRSYQEVIRINSQSGKGGVAHIMQREFGLDLPRWLQVDFSRHVQSLAEQRAGEVSAADLRNLFQQVYLSGAGTEGYRLAGYELRRQDGRDLLEATLQRDGEAMTVCGTGCGVVDAFVNALARITRAPLVIVDYSEHALEHTTEARAISYVQLSVDGHRISAAAISADIVAAPLEAILDGVNQALAKRAELAA